MPWPNFTVVSSDTVAIAAPETLSFTNNYLETVGFLHTLREVPRISILLRKTSRIRRIYADFKTIRSLAPAAALCLVAELDRWRHLHLPKLHTVDLDKWHPTIRRLLFEMGFFDLLEVDVPDAVEGQTISDRRWIRFRSGDENAGQFAQELRIELEKVKEPFPNKTYLYDALVEAMANAVEHAYPSYAPQGIAPVRLGRRWWMSGSIDFQASRIRILFCDQGVTIPVSLPRSTIAEQIRGFLQVQNLLDLSDDGKMIAAAMEVRRTGTGAAHRGRGLANLRRLAELDQGNRLRIVSRRGYYQFSPAGGEVAQTRALDLRGTLIEWDLAVGKIEPISSEVS